MISGITGGIEVRGRFNGMLLYTGVTIMVANIILCYEFIRINSTLKKNFKMSLGLFIIGILTVYVTCNYEVFGYLERIKIIEGVVKNIISVEIIII